MVTALIVRSRLTTIRPSEKPSAGKSVFAIVLRTCLRTSNQRWGKTVGLLQPQRKFSTSIRSLPAPSTWV